MVRQIELELTVIKEEIFMLEKDTWHRMQGPMWEHYGQSGGRRSKRKMWGRALLWFLWGDWVRQEGAQT